MRLYKQLENPVIEIRQKVGKLVTYYIWRDIRPQLNNYVGNIMLIISDEIDND